MDTSTGRDGGEGGEGGDKGDLFERLAAEKLGSRRKCLTVVISREDAAKAQEHLAKQRKTDDPMEAGGSGGASMSSTSGPEQVTIKGMKIEVPPSISVPEPEAGSSSSTSPGREHLELHLCEQENLMLQQKFKEQERLLQERTAQLLNLTNVVDSLIDLHVLGLTPSGVAALSQNQTPFPANSFPIGNPTSCGNVHGDSGVQFNMEPTNDKVLTLFQEVLPIIQRLPYAVKLKCKDILNCRLVCQDWKRAVDYMWSEDPHHQDLFDVTTYPEQNFLWFGRTRLPRCKTIYSGTEKLQIPSQVQKLLSDFPPGNSATANPFPSRNVLVNLQFTNLADSIRFRTLFYAVLRKFGKEVWYFTIYSRDTDFTNFYDSLCDWIGLMPNLKVLTLDCDWRDGQKLNRVHQDIKQRHFPRLDNLKVFQCTAIISLIQSVLKVNGNSVEKVAIVKSDVKMGTFPVFREMYSGEDVALPSLVELSIHVTHWTDTSFLAKFKWPRLEALNISFDTPECYKVLGCFQTENLVILRTPHSDLFHQNNLHLNLGNLKVLEVAQWNLSLAPQLQLEFLQPPIITNLEILKVVTTFGESSGQGSLEAGRRRFIDRTSFGAFVNHFVTQSEWVRFPGLKLFEVHVHGYPYKIWFRGANGARMARVELGK